MIFNLLKKIAKPFYGTGIGKYPFFKQLFYIFTFLFETSQPEESMVDTIYGFKLFVSNKWRVVERNLSILGVWEKDISEIVRTYLRPGDVFLDLGANIGYYSLLASTITGKSGKVISFEPSMENYTRLKRNMRLNNAENISIHKLGVGNKNVQLEIFFSEENPWSTSFISSHNNMGDNKEKVQIVVLDDFLKWQKIDFIKMDIEWYEYNALLWMKELLRENTTIKMIFEFSPCLYKLFVTDYRSYSKDLLQLLADMWFSLYNITDWLSEIMDIDAFVEKVQDIQTDILALRKIV